MGSYGYTGMHRATRGYLGLEVPHSSIGALGLNY